MNKKLWICILVLALLCGMAGCKKDQADMPAAEAADPTTLETTLPEESTQPEETIQLPEGEGVESLDEIVDGEDNVADDPVETKPQNTTKPTETPAQKPTETPAQNPTEAPAAPETTEPAQAPETQQPTESQPAEPPATEAPTTPPVADTGCNCAYQQYMAMSAVEQEAYMNSFESPLAFIEWVKQAQAEHEAHDTSVKVEGGDLDIGDFINP